MPQDHLRRFETVGFPDLGSGRMPELVRRPRPHTGLPASLLDRLLITVARDHAPTVVPKDQLSREIGQERPEKQLGLRPDRDDPLLAMMLGFMRTWLVYPNDTETGDVA